MKTTERFDKAVTKLYNAFHSGTLDAYRCSACAVGNMCDGYLGWGANREYIGAPINDSYAVSISMYSPKELGMVEVLFMEQFDNVQMAEKKEQQFQALCAVVEYLCELDGIPNVVDYTALFETENGSPKHELSEVL